MVRCSDNSLYCGQTNNLKNRIKEHNTSQTRSSKYTKGRRPVQLVYFEKMSSLQLALRREWQVKKWPKAKKEAIITGNKKLP